MRDSFELLSDDIKRTCSLSTPEGSGFYAVYCPVCKKMERKTGGFRFDIDKIIYNCFRGSCDASCVYEKNGPVSRKFRNLMKEIGVKIPVDLSMKKSSLQKAIDDELEEHLYKKHFFKEMKVPSGFVPLASSGNRKWVAYYESRKCPIDDIFYIKKGDYQGLTAIGFYHFDKFIGYQVVNPDSHVKYRTITDNDHLIYFGNNALQSNTVLVVEGALDAKSMPNTVATLSSRISPEQAWFLRGKDVIMIPDRSANRYIDQFHEYGWKLCIPPWDEKDLDDAVRKYGVMCVARMIMDNTVSDKFEATVKYELWKENK